MLRYNYQNEHSSNLVRASSVWAFVVAAMALSNATKNKTDLFSAMFQSYWTKTHTTIFYSSLAIFVREPIDVMGMLIFGAFALLMLCDTLIGFEILHSLYCRPKSNI